MKRKASNKNENTSKNDVSTQNNNSSEKEENFSEVEIDTVEGKKKVKVARLKNLKNQKSESDKYKVQFLETLVYNEYNFEYARLALKYDILKIHNWILHDSHFRALLRQTLAVFKTILKIKICNLAHKETLKVRDYISYIELLPDFQESTAPDGDVYTALIPIVLSKDFEKLAEGKIDENAEIGKMEIQISGEGEPVIQE